LFGRGLIKGLQITWKEFWTPKFTVQYPEEKHPVPARFHGRFVVDADKCIACNLCANACPNRVINIVTAKVGTKKYLTNYIMNIQYCLFCGLCVEACNKDAIHFSDDFGMCQYFYKNIPLVLVDRVAPEAPPEDAESKAPADATDKAAKKTAAAKAKGTEG